MKFYGKAHQTAQTILDAFQEPEKLPKALAPIFIHRDDDVPCRKWSWRNQLLTALACTQDARGYRQWQQADRHVKKGAKAFLIPLPMHQETERRRHGRRKAHLLRVPRDFRLSPRGYRGSGYSKRRS